MEGKTKRELKREHARLAETVIGWLLELREYRLRNYNPKARELENQILAGIQKMDEIAQQM